MEIHCNTNIIINAWITRNATDSVYVHINFKISFPPPKPPKKEKNKHEFYCCKEFLKFYHEYLSLNWKTNFSRTFFVQESKMFYILFLWISSLCQLRPILLWTRQQRCSSGQMQQLLQGVVELNVQFAMSVLLTVFCTCAVTCACATSVPSNSGGARAVATARSAGPSYATWSEPTNPDSGPWPPHPATFASTPGSRVSVAQSQEEMSFQFVV